ncbi:MAG: ribosome small subunit-dependent GTPase A [Chloroflexota bacterium]
MSDLEAFGWDDGHAAAFAGLVSNGSSGARREPGRVVVEERGQYLVRTALDESPAEISGRFRFGVTETADFPAVGDWVVLERAGRTAVIHATLPRRTALVRRTPGDRDSSGQVLAANIDLVFVVTSMDGDLNLRRLERFLAVAWESGAQPIVVLSKEDVAADPRGAQLAVDAIAQGVPILSVSALRGSGMDAIRERLLDRQTVAVVGSSGVGKSTLINVLLGEALLDTGGVREDDSRGRHTTTRRHLLRLSRGLIIDTPGMRELGLADEGGLDRAFDDIAALAADCRFTDCAHRSEPGCAVRLAIDHGALTEERLEAHQKLEQEGAHQARRHDALARIAERKKWKQIGAATSRHMREKYGDDR